MLAGKLELQANSLAGSSDAPISQLRSANVGGSMKVRITAGVRRVSARQHKRSSLERHFAQRRERARNGSKRQTIESSNKARYQSEKR